MSYDTDNDENQNRCASASGPPVTTPIIRTAARQQAARPRQVTVTGQMLTRKPESWWPVTVTLDTYFSERA